MFMATGDTVAKNLETLKELLTLGLEWAGKHASKFDIPKFQLIHFTLSKEKYDPLPLVVNGVTIRAQETVKYLGLMVDRTLRWHEQCEAARAKGMATLLAISRLTRPTFGMPHKYVRRLFKAVAIPRMEYALEV